MVDRLMKVTYSASLQSGAYINVEANMPSSELGEWLVHVEEEVVPYDFTASMEPLPAEGTAPQGDAATQ